MYRVIKKVQQTSPYQTYQIMTINKEQASKVKNRKANRKPRKQCQPNIKQFIRCTDH